ncbi:putative adenine phosphoribosyltransferase [Diaporthe ampelina]|uniref:adenine phosphoribosyltransferase n=1 Tax=Diaporthe ampelina TaxID=1214573 RepID=A0A0G2FLV6_9PEZI|nr:putative adenine phosphoribosyltransferase [Diaporthe ampelina]
MPPASEPQGKLATNPDASAASSSTAAAAAHHASGRQPTASSSTSAELASAKISLEKSLRRFPDFPIPGINFLDIMPWFLDPAVHATLLRSLELQLLHFGDADNAIKPDVIVGLDARGFLFGPSLALRLNASFVPVRKQGKLPGPCVTAEYTKEYGVDYFQMQEGAIKPGQKVLVVDDIIATGGSAAAAGDLIKQLGGSLVGFLFIIEIPFLKGREKLDNVPVVTLLDVNE